MFFYNIVKKFFNFNTIAGVENTSTVNATAIKLGDTITMQGSATNGIAPYKYAFYYRKSGESKWVEKQKFDTNDVVSIKPNQATDYDICIKVQDAGGFVEKKYFVVTVS